jgi:high affinity Mn2+ porin
VTNHSRSLRFFPAVLIVIFAPWNVSAQSDEPPPPASVLPGEESFWSRFWISVQGNFIRQQYPTFSAPYSGPNSFLPAGEHATSRVETLYTGFQITNQLEILTDIESAGGAGLSNALGIAGFPNVDVVRNPTLPEAPYVARVMLHYTIPLSEATTEATRNPLSLAATVPERRLELRLGKMSAVDFFDLNSIGSDSHLQFMNWATVNNAAFDYAADTRGYTYGLLAEYYDKLWAARFGEMLMPTVANGMTLDWDIARARGENFEVEHHPNLLSNRQTVVRALGFVNHADMGSYREAINGYLSGKDAVPDVTLYRRQGNVKYGFGLNAEQELNSLWRVFFRLGWNDGRNESFAYTEVDRTSATGSDFRGKPWRRPKDRIGAAYIIDGISGDHRRYLALGGLGFILGDGHLSYGLERIFETYYTAHVWRGLSVAGDYQYIDNPGYNMARGPVSVFSLRLHIEEAIPLDRFFGRN